MWLSDTEGSMAMTVCVLCGSKTRCVDSRRMPEGYVRRKYRCESDEEHEYRTIEMLVEDAESVHAQQANERLRAALAFVYAQLRSVIPKRRVAA